MGGGTFCVDTLYIYTQCRKIKTPIWVIFLGGQKTEDLANLGPPAAGVPGYLAINNKKKSPRGKGIEKMFGDMFGCQMPSWGSYDLRHVATEAEY